MERFITKLTSRATSYNISSAQYLKLIVISDVANAGDSKSSYRKSLELLIASLRTLKQGLDTMNDSEQTNRNKLPTNKVLSK